MTLIKLQAQKKKEDLCVCVCVFVFVYTPTQTHTYIVVLQVRIQCCNLMFWRNSLSGVDSYRWRQCITLKGWYLSTSASLHSDGNVK